MENYNDNYYDVNNPFEPKKRRPVFLTVLCILTFIGSGINVLSYTAWALMGDSMASMQMPFQMEQAQEMISRMTEVAAWKYGIIVLLYLGSIFGAVMMLFMKKLGFHIYAVVQSILLFLPSYFIFDHVVPDIFSFIITATFIILYGIYYKKMSWSFNEETHTDPTNDEQ